MHTLLQRALCKEKEDAAKKPLAAQPLVKPAKGGRAAAAAAKPAETTGTKCANALRNLLRALRSRAV